MSNERKFWMVKGRGPTSHQHRTREDAEAEAQRLARTTPGQRFYVLEATAYHVRNETQRVQLDDPYEQFGCRSPCGDPECDGIPF